MKVKCQFHVSQVLRPPATSWFMRISIAFRPWFLNLKENIYTGNVGGHRYYKASI